MEAGVTLENRLSEGKEVHFYRSWLALFPWILGAALCVLLGLWLIILVPESIQAISLLGWEIKVPLTGLVPLMLVAVVLHKMYDSHYVVGPDYVRQLDGLLSLSKDDIIIELKDIRGVEIERNIYGRLVNTGDLKIGTAASDRHEITLRYIRDPSSFRDLILTQRKMLLEAQSPSR